VDLQPKIPIIIEEKGSLSTLLLRTAVPQTSHKQAIADTPSKEYIIRKRYDSYRRVLKKQENES
jgi:hypothetical protein